jgi:Flp pilus assembly protein protease CpaA
MYGLMLGIFLMILSLAALVDLKEGFIPDSVMFAGYIVAMILTTGPHWTDMPGAFETGLIAFFGLYLPFRLYAAIRGQVGMGCADMHLIAICGLFLGHKLIWIVFPLISFLVVTWYVFHKQWLPRGLFVQVVGAKGIPAGPAIVAATYVITAMMIGGHL